MSRATQDDTYRRQRSRKGLSPAAAPLSNGLRSDAPLTCGGPTTPQGPEPLRFGLFPSRSPLLGESLLFSFPAGTKMFQFPAFASVISTYGCQVFNLTGFPIRRSAGQRSFAPHRSFSQLITSFIACGSLGIRHTPFPTFLRFSFHPYSHLRPHGMSIRSVRSSISFFYKKEIPRFLAVQHVKDRAALTARWWRITDSNR